MIKPPDPDRPPSFVTGAEGLRLAYRDVAAPNGAPTVVFLPGLKSDMAGSKAVFLEGHAAASGLGFLRLDYSGHGESEGAFTEGTLSRWREDALAVIDQAAPSGPLLLVGSSMGGWLMLLVALARRARVAGLIGIAAAPDFTREIEARASAEVRAAWARDGVWHEPSDYGEPLPLTRRLVEDGAGLCLLDGPIALTCRVILLQGMQDPDVPWQKALRIAERLEGEDIEIDLIKDGDHRLSRPQDLSRLAQALDRLAGRAA